jgi:hypothetical protein
VHCKQHRTIQSKKRRLESWRSAFPSGTADGSVPEVSIEQLFRKALKPLSTKCISQNNKEPCKERIGGRKVQNCERTLQELIKHEKYSDDVELELLLKVMEYNMNCTIHQSSEQVMWKEWKKSVMKVLPLPMPLGDRVPAMKAPNELQISPGAQKNAHPSISPDVDPASYWPEVYDLTPFEKPQRSNYDASPESLHKLILKRIENPLARYEITKGYVYAYEVEGNEGYVKIGYTSRSLAERHDEWSFDCNRKTKPIFPASAQATATVSGGTETTMTEAVFVPHAGRVEALCHAELNNHRIKIYCSACQKEHIEWFKVSAIEATNVIQKWSRWMATRPYEQRLRGGVWTLKMGEEQRI